MTDEMTRRGWATDEELEGLAVCPIHNQLITWGNHAGCAGCIAERGRQIAEHARQNRIREALEIAEVRALVYAADRMRIAFGVGDAGHLVANGRSYEALELINTALTALEWPTDH